MNILITVHSYAPNKDGVQFVTQYLAEGLKEKGHQITVITYLYEERCNIDSEEINYVRVMRWKAKTKYTLHFGSKKKYQNYLIENQSKFDIMINIGTQTALTDWIFEIFEKIKLPKVLYIHSIWDFKLKKDDLYSIKKFLAKLCANFRWYIYYKKNFDILKRYDSVIQLHTEDYSTKYFEKKYGIKSFILENAAEKDCFIKDVEKKINKKYIINISNFNIRKNQKKCIEYFFKSDIPKEWKLILIGSQENSYSKFLRKYEQKLRKNIKGKEVIILTGLSRDVTKKYLKEASIYLLTSIWEAFPISLVEAMAAGVPFISSNVGIVKYLKGGIIAENEIEFKEAIEKLIFDENLHKKYAISGNEEAKLKYQIEDKVNILEKHLLKLVEEKGVKK